MLRSSAVTRLVAVSASTITAAALLSGTVAACHPQGTITKSVQDVTTGSTLVAADSAATALVVHPGDTLTYQITVSDSATGAINNMITTKVTDQLPAGLSLVKADNFDLGTVAGGQKKTITVTAKVTATTNTTIANQACFTGDSIDHKVPQKGCDLAYVKVVVPATPSPTPTPSVSPSPTPAVLGDSTVTTLPQTGAESALSVLIGLPVVGVAARAYLRSRK